MARKVARSAPSTTVWDARGADSRLHLASGLQKGRRSASIQARSGVTRGIPAESVEVITRLYGSGAG
jgi:hypothetical protein